MRHIQHHSNSAETVVSPLDIASLNAYRATGRTYIPTSKSGPGWLIFWLHCPASVNCHPAHVLNDAFTCMQAILDKRTDFKSPLSATRARLQCLRPCVSVSKPTHGGVRLQAVNNRDYEQKADNMSSNKPATQSHASRHYPHGSSNYKGAQPNANACMSYAVALLCMCVHHEHAHHAYIHT